MESVGGGLGVVLVRARSWTCALRIEDAIEIMRPLPIQPLAGVPDFVRGLAIVRGKVLPVLDLAAILGARGNESVGRFLAARAGPREIVLAVDEVMGVSHLDPSSLENAPPLLQDALPAVVQKLGTMDGDVLAMLQAGRVVPDEVWRLLEHGGGE